MRLLSDACRGLLLCLAVSVTSSCHEAMDDSEQGVGQAGTIGEDSRTGRGARISQPGLFFPPESGRLNMAQIRMYYAFNARLENETSGGAAERQKRSMPDKPGVFVSGGVAERVMAELGTHEAEYSWVKDRVIEASTRLLLEEVYELNGQIIARLEGALAFYKQTRLEQKSPPERAAVKQHIQEIEQQIRELKDDLASRSHMSPAAAYNVNLLLQYRQTLAQDAATGALVGPEQSIQAIPRRGEGLPPDKK